jgi:hypothetical protein
LEWGTITRVSVPDDLQAEALLYKGKGLRKTGGVYPHPFFFKQRPLAKKAIEDRITAITRDIKL